MKPKPSDFAKAQPGSLRDRIDLPTLKVSARPSPGSSAAPADKAYGIDSLDKLVDAFDERVRILKKSL
jgi:hypothetical protein